MSDEEKKEDISPTKARANFDPSANNNVDLLNLMGVNSASQLDKRLIYGLSSPSVSPERTIYNNTSLSPSKNRSLSPSAQQNHSIVSNKSISPEPTTRTQLLTHLKAKHEFSSILSSIVPSDISHSVDKTKQGIKDLRARSRRGRRRGRGGDRHASRLSSPIAVYYDDNDSYQDHSLDHSLSSHHSSDHSYERATTASPGKRQKDPYIKSSISLYDDSVYGSVVSADTSHYQQQQQHQQKSVSSILQRPWSEEDRGKRGKNTSLSPEKFDTSTTKRYDKFSRPKEDSRWRNDDYGYLWADDQDYATSKDLAALANVFKGGDEGDRVKDLVTAYGGSIKESKKQRRKNKKDKDKKLFAEGYSGVAGLKFGGKGMGPTSGSTILPTINKNDGLRNVRGRESAAGGGFDDMFSFIDAQRSVVENHVYDLERETKFQERKERGIHLGIVWEIEKMKSKLPMAFLQQWGMGGEFSVNKAVKVIIRVITKFRHNKILSFWNKWKSVVDKMIEVEFNQRMLLFQQSGALKTFEAIGKRCLHYAAAAGFQLWREKIEAIKFAERHRDQVAAVLVIQAYIRNRQAEKRAMRSMKAVVVLALHNRDMINMVLAFEKTAVPLVAHHKSNKAVKLKEEMAASVIRRNWNAHISRAGVLSLVLGTRARKKKAFEDLLLKSTILVQHNWRARNDRIGMMLFRENRRKRIEAERQARALAADEAKMGLAVKQERTSAANVIRRGYRCYRFVMRFNKKAHERKKAALALQLLKHKKSCIIQRAFRTHRFLAVFNQKAHARKLKWMAEAEAKAKREYEAACFLQDCWRRAHNRHSMKVRFGDRKNMMKQAEVLREQNKRALVIQMAYNKFKGRENLQTKIMMRKLREEEEKKQRLVLAQKKAVFKQRMKASKIIQHSFRTYRFLCIFNQKAYERKQAWLARQLLEHEMATIIQHSYRTHRFLSTFNSKAKERKNRWLARQLLEHNSASIVQKNFRTYRFLMTFNQKAHERKKAWMREAERKAKEAYEAMLERMATRIQMFCQAQMEKYNQPVRILARRQLEVKRKIAREKAEAEALEKAARIVQHAWRMKGERDMLMGRFTKRRALMQKKGYELMRNDMATKIAHAYLRHLDRLALRRRVVQRAELHKKIAIHRERDAAARILQRNYRLSRARFVQSLKFEQMRRRLATERLLEEQTALAELAARRAAEARLAAEEALKQMVDQGWKLGSDPHGRNYWYNWVTGESTWIKPSGWKIKQDETWIKNTDSNGNVYYFNQLTMETKWMPPCEVCQKEAGKRICEDCDFKTYCLNCYESKHEHMPGGKDHRWKGADIDKDTLQPGEKYCIKCQVTAAKKCCKVCKDAYCERCFRDVHAVGNISKHPWVTWADFKAGWQEVKGRVDGERNYYFNATTLQSVNEKPEELMLEEELAEHKEHIKYFKENEKNKDRVKKLEEKVQQYEYEKDQLWFEMNMKKSAEAEELELLRSALDQAEAKKRDQWKKMLLHPIAFYKEWVIEKKKAQQAYRRKLLLSAKQRKQIGINAPPEKKKE
jgi:hypothetical protein